MKSIIEMKYMLYIVHFFSLESSRNRKIKGKIPKIMTKQNFSHIANCEQKIMGKQQLE